MVNSRYHIVLASNSPRRKELLSGLDIPFEVRVLDGIDESYPAELSTKEIAGYISKKKADAYQMTMGADELIITADTIVVLGRQDTPSHYRRLSDNEGAAGEFLGGDRRNLQETH